MAKNTRKKPKGKKDKALKKALKFVKKHPKLVAAALLAVAALGVVLSNC